MNSIVSKLVLAGSKVGVKVVKHAPKILVIGGCIGFVGTCVLVAKSACKVEEKLDHHNDKKREITDKYDGIVESGKSTYTDIVADQDKELKAEKRRFIREMICLWAPPVLAGATSITMILCGFNILDGRYVATSAALQASEKSFRDYRSRVVADQGDDADRRYFYGVDNEATTTTDENGNQIINVNPVIYNQPKHPFAKFFDETSREWMPSPEMNLAFLIQQQNYANDKLHAQGHLFLNEVYDLVGLPHTQIGAVCGWVDRPGAFVDFGIWDGSSDIKRAFVNGYEPSILLDFNCDAGTIWDQI